MSVLLGARHACFFSCCLPLFLPCSESCPVAVGAMWPERLGYSAACLHGKSPSTPDFRECWQVSGSPGPWFKHSTTGSHPNSRRRQLVPTWSWTHTLPAPCSPGPWQQFPAFEPDLDFDPPPGGSPPEFGWKSAVTLHCSSADPAGFTWSGELRKHRPMEERKDLLAEKSDHVRKVFAADLGSSRPDLGSLPAFLVLPAGRERLWRRVSFWQRWGNASHSSKANRWEASLIQVESVVSSGHQEPPRGSRHYLECQLLKT